MIRVCLNVGALLFLFGICSAYGTVISGQVRDKSNGQVLPSATIQVKGTYQGTVANESGEYKLDLERYPAVIRVTYIGYQSKEVEIADSLTARLDIALEPAPLVMEEIVVTAENPAVRIMRQVIRRKREWRPLIERFRANAYSRWSLESDGQIVGIGEGIADIYWDHKAGWREVIQSRHLSENLRPIAEAEDKKEEVFSFVEAFYNLYDDEIEILDHRVIGPTHPDALKHYHFKLESTRHLDDRIVYDISMRPKNKLQSAFKGRLAVLGEEFAMLEADLKPVKHIIEVIPIPFVEIEELSYRQQFRQFEEGVWLPVDFRHKAVAKFDVVRLLQTPHLGFNSISHVTKYEVNTALPDSVYARDEVLHIDTLVVQSDSLVLAYKAKVPYSPKEAKAYEVLDSTQTWDRLIELRGPLGRAIIKGAEEERQERAMGKKKRKKRKKRRAMNLARTWRCPSCTTTASMGSMGDLAAHTRL